MKIGAAYIRVSTNMQEELSPDAQKRLLLEYALKNDIILSNEYIFIENGISGKNANKRPEFQRMIATAKTKPKPFEVILLWKFSRFARNQDEASFYKGILRKKCGIDVVSITEPLMDGMYGRLIEMIIEWSDEFYSYNLAQEVTRGMTEKALRGGYQARPPLGYRIEVPKTPPVIVPEEASVIQMIFEKYVYDHQDLYSLTRHLNQLGFTTSRRKPFEKRSLEYIIQNPVYIGKTRWNRTENATNRIKSPDEWILADGQHEAIISEELFQLANERYASEYTPRNARPSAIRKHWLSGMLRCSACGRTLSSTQNVRGDRSYTSFRCYGYLKGKCEVSHSISANKIIPTILKMIKSDLDNDTLVYETLTPQSNSQDLALFHDQLTKLSAKERRIKDAYMNGIDTLEEYKASKAILQNEKKDLESQILMLQTANSELPSPAAMKQRVMEVYDIIRSDATSTEEKNKAIQSIIKQMIYHKATNEVDIYYYFS